MFRPIGDIIKKRSQKILSKSFDGSRGDGSGDVLKEKRGFKKTLSNNRKKSGI